MNTREQLRLNGYSTTAAGHIDCHAAGAARPYGGVDIQHPRFEQEHCAVIRVDVIEGDRRAASELIEALVAAADTPRALVGTSRSGCVMLFRHDGGDILPKLPGHVGGVFELATVGGTVRFNITFGSVGHTLNVSEFNWGKRSPLDVERDRLPALTHDVSQAVLAAGFKVATWSSLVASPDEQRRDATRLERFKADVAAGRIKITETETERAEREARELVAANDGRDLAASDGMYATLVLNARKVVARLNREKSAA
jgi:hypothetical protein